MTTTDPLTELVKRPEHQQPHRSCRRCRGVLPMSRFTTAQFRGTGLCRRCASSIGFIQ